MEIVHLLLMKSSDDFVQEISSTCFLPLFFVLANDDSEKCRLSAAGLLREIFRKADKERTQTFLGLVRTWLDQDGNEAVLKLAFQVFGFYLESNENASKNKKDFKLVLEKINGVIKNEDIRDVDGELLEAALEVIRAALAVFPEKILASNSEEMWSNIVRCLSHQETSVKLSSIGLTSSYLADFAQQAGSSNVGEPVEGSHGLTLDLPKVQNLVRLGLGVLATRDIDEKLGAEAVQVLAFLAPRLPEGDGEEEEDEEEEEQAEESKEKTERKTDLEHLFRQISHVIRREIPPRAVAITPKVAAMELLETVCRRSSLERLRPSFKTILVPLHNLTDPSIAPPFSNDELFKTKHEALKTRAQILMDSLQKKFGTAEYSKQLLAIREEVRKKREERSSKRKIDAIVQPEKYGRDKRKKFEKNKSRLKTRSKEQKVMRQSFKRW
jgi:U3 small nucleolar RNA-associated protein 20